MIPVEREVTLAQETETGRETLALLHRIRAKLTGEQRLAKSFELTETTRQLMRAGIVTAHPDLDENEIRRLYIDRLLNHHGLSIKQIEDLRKKG
jgi:hypothetical protein